MGMKKIGLIIFIMAALALLVPQFQSEPERADPRYALVIGDQLKFRIDFVFAPFDFIRDEPELVKNVLLPAMGLASYDDGDSASD